jgi:hypothetical protein
MPQFALRSSTTLVVGRVDGSAPAEQARFEVPQADVAALSPNGLLTALTSGTVLISASKDGALGLIQIAIQLSNDSDGDGMPPGPGWSTQCSGRSPRSFPPSIPRC